jgi:D-alanine-D-alanine ligase-like ATP-grasp enzyme
MSLTRVGIIRHIENKNLEKINNLFDIFQNELSDKYKVVDIYIDENNIWHSLGIPVLPMDLYHRVDIFWNENDPHIMQTLSHIGIPHISKNPFHSLLENNKNNLQKYLQSLNISTPRNFIIPPYQKDFDQDLNTYVMQKAKEVWNKFSPPYTLHTSSENNLATFVVKTFPELYERMYELLAKGDNVLVEEIILGEKHTSYFLPKFRNQDYYSLLGSNLKNDIKNHISEIGKLLIDNLGIKHYLKVDFIVKGNKVYIENIKTSIDFKDLNFKSNIKSFGIQNRDIIEHIFKNAII